MTPGQIVGLVVGILVVVAVVLLGTLSVVFSTLKKKLAADHAALEHEGIEKESDDARGSLRYRDFRAPGFYASRSFSGVSGRLILTRATFSFHSVGSRMRHVPRGELGRYAVTTNADGHLVISTDQPHNASGHMELHLRLPDAEAWAQALRAAGATGG
jgi:hypothetical protein